MWSGKNQNTQCKLQGVKLTRSQRTTFDLGRIEAELIKRTPQAPKLAVHDIEQPQHSNILQEPVQNLSVSNNAIQPWSNYHQLAMRTIYRRKKYTLINMQTLSLFCYGRGDVWKIN